MKIQKDCIHPGNIIIYRLFDNKNQEIKVVTEFLRFSKVKNYSPSTIKNYAFDLKCYFSYLSSKRKNYKNITAKELIEFLDDINNKYRKSKNYKASNGLSPSTIKRILAAVSSFNTWHEMIFNETEAKNPLIKVENHNFPGCYMAYKGNN